MKHLSIFTGLVLLASVGAASAQSMSSRSMQSSQCYGSDCNQSSRTRTSQANSRINGANQVNAPTRGAQVEELCTETRIGTYLNFTKDLKDFVTPYEYADILIPIRQKALNTINTLKIYGSYHAQTHKSFIALIKEINNTQEFLNNFSHIEAFYEIINDINFVTMSLERSLYN